MLEWSVEIRVVCCYDAVILLNNQKEHRHLVIEKCCSSNAVFVFNIEALEEIRRALCHSRVIAFSKSRLLHKSE